MIENLQVDAGISYLDNEPLGRLTAVPLYREELCADLSAGRIRWPGARRSTGRSWAGCRCAC